MTSLTPIVLFVLVVLLVFGAPVAVALWRARAPRFPRYPRFPRRPRAGAEILRALPPVRALPVDRRRAGGSR